MADMGRRSFLKGMAIAPVAVPASGAAAAHHIAMESAIVGQLPMPSQAPVAGVNESIKFTSFAKWFTDFGKAELERRARDITGFDPDILMMHLPPQAKVRMQIRRNYERLVKEHENHFTRIVSRQGAFHHWG